MNWQGAWSSSKAYAIRDGVQRSGNAYICTVANTNKDPVSFTSQWNLIAAAGAVGPQGPSGNSATIQDEGSALTSRAALNFKGAGVTATDDSANNRTNVTIATNVQFMTSHGYVIGGPLSSSINVPDFYVAKESWQVISLLKIIAAIEGGTSIDVTVRRNAHAIGTAHTITTTPQTITYNQALSDGDALDLTFANPVGSPVDLGLTLVLESIVTA
jgi:hypothetical protein